MNRAAHVRRSFLVFSRLPPSWDVLYRVGQYHRLQLVQDATFCARDEDTAQQPNLLKLATSPWPLLIPVQPPAGRATYRILGRRRISRGQIDRGTSAALFPIQRSRVFLLVMSFPSKHPRRTAVPLTALLANDTEDPKVRLWMTQDDQKRRG